MATPPHPTPQRTRKPLNSSPQAQQSQRSKTHFSTALTRSPRARAEQSIMCKVAITIPSLVWLRRTARRWRSRAASGGGAASSNNKLDADAAEAVPAGHVAVRVEGGGDGPRRFVVRLAHLNHPAFRELLRQAAEEYGFPTAASGPIALPCDEDRFLDVLHRVSSSGSVVSCCCGQAAVRRGGSDSRPLLQGMAVEKLVW